VELLYDLHMGAENMRPLLYSIARFVKCKRNRPRVLEVGAGYTSLFLLQALEDNARELELYRLRLARTARCGAMPWSVDSYFDTPHEPVLHVIDNIQCRAQAHTTAHRVSAAAKGLGISSARLVVHVQDAFNADLPCALAADEPFSDFVWIDLGAAARVEHFFDDWWPRVDPRGGVVIIHSTLTNAKRRAASVSRLDGPHALARDFLEPHKMFQNSCSIFQKRGEAHGLAHAEPVLTKVPVIKCLRDANTAQHLSWRSTTGRWTAG
ncbi:hypothetical protein M885DRAFT_433706, partial [Pelagophyceae sp. CCMP2097]